MHRALSAASVPKDIDEYIAGCSESVQPILEKLRRTIRKAAPAASEAIKYRMPTFVLKENLVHFAAFEKHIGFYPAPSGIERFKDRLTEFKWAKGSVQFPFGKPLPLRLIEDIVRFRVGEVAGKQPARKRK